MGSSMIHTEKYKLSNWIFYSPSQQKISVDSPQLILTTHLDSILQCRLIFNVDWNAYQLIKTKELFYLEADMMKFYERESLNPNHLITISALLALPILPDVEEYYWPSADISSLSNYFERLFMNNQESPLFLTESWLLLSVSQQNYQSNVHYRTVWDYLNWNEINREENEEEMQKLLLPAIFEFLQDTMLNSLTTETNMGTLTPDVFALNKVLISSLFDSITHLIGNNPDQSKIDLKYQVASFLQKEGYVFSQDDEDGSKFWLKVQGINGKWISHINVRSAENQIIIYSILPNPISNLQNLNIFQFICELNSGLSIGNFEIDSEEAELLFKTSLDFEGTNFQTSLLKQLILINFQTVDHYLLDSLAFLTGS